MSWLNELIWVGNTLYPRWFLAAVPAVFFAWLALVYFAASNFSQS